MKYYIKSKLRPYVKGPIRELLNRVQGLTNTSPPHEAIAALVGKPDPTILEIGSNDGSDTLALLRAMPQATIYCFEPDARAVARFKGLFGSNLDKVTLFEVAVSHRSGKINFYPSDGGDRPEGWDLSGSIRRPKNHLKAYPRIKFENTVNRDHLPFG